MLTQFFRASRKFLTVGGLFVAGLAASASAAQAITISDVRLFSNGGCDGTSATIFLIQVSGSSGEFPDQDVLVTFSGGSTQYYDAHVWYVLDASGKIISTTYGNNFATNTGVFGISFFNVTNRPTVSGNLTVILQDESDGFPDQSVGATYVAGSGQRASLSFDAAALDPDCVPAPSDSTAPVVTVPGNVSVSTDPGQSTAVVSYATPTATDNVGVTSGPTRTAGLASGSAFPVGITTVTYAASDAAGNTGTGSFTVTVSDNEAPAVTVPANISVVAAPGNSSAVVNYPAPSATDNVGVFSGPTRTAGLASGASFPIGVTTVTFSATDAAGNTGSNTFTVTVTEPDTTPPVITVPTDIVASTDPGASSAVVTYATPTATDNVGVTSGPTRTAGPASGASFPLGTTTVTYSAEDAAGNTNTASFTVTVTDDEAPSLNVPSNIAVSTDPGSDTAVVLYSMPTATDNVAVVSGPTLATGLASGSAFPVGITTVSYTAADSAGNIGTGSFTVTVSDGENPVVTVPANISVSTDAAQATALVTYSAPAATDNVGVASGPTLTAGLASGSPFPVGTTTVTYEATDNAGNIGRASFTVTVTDGQGPVVTVPGSIVVPTDPGKATAVVTYSVPSATDNIGVTSGPTLTEGLGSGATFPLGTTTITYEAEDNQGNVGSASFTITVEDREAPVIRSVGSVTLEADPSGTRRVGFSTIVEDNVDSGIAPVFSLGGNIITSPYDFPVGANVVTINASDTAGNDAPVEQFTITITPGTAPDIPLITTAVINADRSLTIGGAAEVDSTVRVTFPDGSFEEVMAISGVYTVTSAADMPGGTVTVTGKDDRGYVSDAATVQLFPDYEGPSVSVAGGPAEIDDISPFDVAITFSEAVTGFDQTDVTVTGGNITSFSGSGEDYIVEITPLPGQTVAVQVSADVAVDQFDNPNTASNVLRISNATRTEVEQFVADAAQARNRALIKSHPRLIQFLLGGRSGRFKADVTQGRGVFDFATSSDYPFWVEAKGQWSTLDDIESSYATLTLGYHYAPSENVLVGVMGIVDDSVSDDGTARVEATGWLVGPYAVARLQNQPLVFSASYLVGRSDNSASPSGTYTDSFDSDRTLATVGMAGEIQLESLTLIPAIDLAHAEETNDGYLGGDGLPVRSMTVTTTEATIGLNFVMPLDVPGGAFDLVGGIGATSSITDDGRDRDESTRGQTEIGFRYTLDAGGRLTARATYDGLGTDDYEAFGIEAAFEVDF